MNKDKVYRWTLVIEVQGKNKAEALLRIQDRIRAFIARGASADDGKTEEIEQT